MELGIIALVVGSLISIFSTDLRSWLIDSYVSIRANNNESYNRKIDEKIQLLKDLSGNAISAISFAATGLFLVLFLLALMIFFGFVLMLKAEPILSLACFFAFWIWSLMFAAYHVDVFTLLRNPERSIERLEGKRRT
jgi:ABC-type multidrug transport system permease subunit